MSKAPMDSSSLSRLVNDAIDKRLGTQRPRTPARLSLRLTHVEKFVSAGKRTIRGLATTGSIDRHGDIVMPRGGVWRLPLPLLWAHDHKSPIGAVRDAVAANEGVRITAEIVEGVPKADEIWRLIEGSVLDSFSIGFIGLEGEPIPTGTRWVRWELMEVSVVSVPSNRDSKIGKGAVLLNTLPRGAVRINTLPPGAVRITRRQE